MLAFTQWMSNYSHYMSNYAVHSLTKNKAPTRLTRVTWNAGWHNSFRTDEDMTVVRHFFCTHPHKVFENYHKKKGKDTKMFDCLKNSTQKWPHGHVEVHYRKRQSLYNRSSSAPFKLTFLYFLSLDLERLWRRKEITTVNTIFSEIIRL